MPIEVDIHVNLDTAYEIMRIPADIDDLLVIQMIKSENFRFVPAGIEITFIWID